MQNISRNIFYFNNSYNDKILSFNIYVRRDLFKTKEIESYFPLISI
jgi:hypothetical protein